jgi:hypothetical protein
MMLYFFTQRRKDYGVRNVFKIWKSFTSLETVVFFVGHRLLGTVAYAA